MGKNNYISWKRNHLSSLAWVIAALMLIILCLLAPWTAPFDPVAIDLSVGLEPPSSSHWFGTDQLGRDVLSRVLWGGRVSIAVSAIVLLISLVVGVLIGLVCGYCGGLVDELGMRVTDFFYSMPSIILTMAMIGIFGSSIPVLILAMSITGWVRYARLAKSLVLVVKSSEYVVAAQAIGASKMHIMRKHLLSSLLGPVAVQLSLDAGVKMLSIASLSFLGLGIQPPTPEWGTMLVDARPFMDYAPHLVLPPGLSIFILIFGFNTLSESLEDRFRPKLT